MTTATLGIRDRAQADLGADTDGEIVYPIEMNILDAVTDAPLPDGQEGEIIARGPGLFVGYLRPSDNKGNFLDDGFFRMGDLGRIVNDNYIVITGRKKDIIIRSGENISPKEVQGNRIWIFAVNAILNVSERWRYSDGDVRGIFFGSRGSARAEHAA